MRCQLRRSGGADDGLVSGTDLVSCAQLLQSPMRFSATGRIASGMELMLVCRDVRVPCAVFGLVCVRAHTGRDRLVFWVGARKSGGKM